MMPPCFCILPERVALRRVISVASFMLNVGSKAVGSVNFSQPVIKRSRLYTINMDTFFFMLCIFLEYEANAGACFVMFEVDCVKTYGKRKFT